LEKFETITVRYSELDFLNWPRTWTAVIVRIQCMFYIQCEISWKWINEHIESLALLETLVYLFQVGICHYTGTFFFRNSEGLKMDRFPHFCLDFAIETVGAWLYPSPFSGEQQMSLWTSVIFHICTCKKHVHFCVRLVATVTKFWN
jgi:hypothetical protein